ncbi:hypothetical protein JW960_07585 [candidate division KSB1 bacterium]|nr:hypothetical protein [candidate division KSB1 bacterium]
MQKILIFVILSSFLCLTKTAQGQRSNDLRNDNTGKTSLAKSYIDDYNNYTFVGDLALTVTNFGILGEGYNNPDQPSCIYRYHSELKSEQVEHFSYGGLWIGGKVNNKAYCSTAIIDGVFPETDEEGFEFTTSASVKDTITIRSSYFSNRDSPLARYYSPDAISHQDFICEFTDKHTYVPGTDILIPEHTPMGVNVHLETYTWSFDYANSFVILNYTITNDTTQTIDSLHAGIWIDPSVGNMNFTSVYEPGGGWNWYDNRNGFLDSLWMAYQYDTDGDQGWSESYFGLRLLGTSLPKDQYNCYYNQWAWNGRAYPEYPDFTMPRTDDERFRKLGSMPEADLPQIDASWMILLSCGSLGSLPPDSSMNVVFAVVCGRWANSSLENTPARLANLIGNSNWAQKAYNGEDVNGDGILTVDEDVNKNGTIDRYILPEPPPSPNLLAVPGDGEVTLFWDNLPEDSTNLQSYDPISNEIDFEGYRIYAARKTAGGNQDFTLLAQFDKIDTLDYSNPNFTDYDTGFEQIRVDTTIDGHRYYYRFVNSNLLNGWPNKNWFAITSFDHGDPLTHLASFESSKNDNKTFAILGTSSEEGYDDRVGVYPNPYRATAAWDGYSARERMIWFMYLPPRATIRIYTLAGDLVDVIEHNEQTYTGSDIELLQNATSGRDPKFSGGEHAWDLITKDDQAVATGLYLFTVENKDTGHIKIGKFAVIK